MHRVWLCSDRFTTASCARAGSQTNHSDIAARLMRILRDNQMDFPHTKNQLRRPRFATPSNQRARYHKVAVGSEST